MNNRKKIYYMLLFIFLIIISSFLIKQSFFEITYTFGNSYGRIIKQGSKNDKVIALTFDDGPHPKYTNEVLDILKQYDAKATFFILGKYAEQYPEIVRRQWEEGHEIGNHTYSHINIKKATKENFQEEFEKTQEAISTLINSEPKIFRPPYGSFDEKVIDVVDKKDSMIILWSAHQDSKDWGNPGVKEIVENTISNIENGDIVLFHDYVYHTESHTVEALKKILPELKNKGYRFVTISELMDLSTE